MKRADLKRISFIAAAVWLIVLLRLTVFRNGCFSHGLFSGKIEVNAFGFYAQLLRYGNLKYFAYLFFGNIIWFAPAGVFTRLWGGRFPHALLYGLLLSLAVESGQFILGSGVSELDDLILNTTGALLGYGACCLVLKRAERRGGKSI